MYVYGKSGCVGVRKRAVAANQWQAHVCQLRDLSKAAAQAAKLQAPTAVHGHRSV